jgi:hypothetical protein
MYKLGRWNILRIDPKPRGWLGVHLPLPQDEVLLRLGEDLNAGRVEPRPQMSSDSHTWVSIVAWSPAMAERFGALIRKAYDSVVAH